MVAKRLTTLLFVVKISVFLITLRLSIAFSGESKAQSPPSDKRESKGIDDRDHKLMVDDDYDDEDDE